MRKIGVSSRLLKNGEQNLTDFMASPALVRRQISLLSIWWMQNGERTILSFTWMVANWGANALAGFMVSSHVLICFKRWISSRHLFTLFRCPFSTFVVPRQNVVVSMLVEKWGAFMKQPTFFSRRLCGFDDGVCFECTFSYLMSNVDSMGSNGIGWSIQRMDYLRK